ncbi:MAG: type II toxin-antitoxin system HigA family antitoxin, partial [Alphaproteobacteria bacterium]
MEVFPIRTDEDHQAAVAEIERLWDAEPGSEAFNRLDVLATLVDAYEAHRWPLQSLDPVDTLRAEMELNGRTLRDLGDLIGRNRATEVL